jgi:hypothetical protein
MNPSLGGSQECTATKLTTTDQAQPATSSAWQALGQTLWTGYDTHARLTLSWNVQGRILPATTQRPVLLQWTRGG